MLAAIAIPDHAAELERLATVTPQLRRLQGVQVSAAHFGVINELGPEVLATERSRTGAGDVAQRVVLLVEQVGQNAAQITLGVTQFERSRLGLPQSEGLVDIQQYRRTVGIENLALDGADALILVGQVQLAARFSRRLATTASADCSSVRLPTARMPWISSARIWNVCGR